VEVRNLFTAYRVLAYIVGILLALMAFVGIPMKYLLTHGSTGQVFGETLTFFVAVAHGWIYMVYLVVAFLLSQRAKWQYSYLFRMVLAGLIPLMMFWVERQVTRRIRTEFKGEFAAP
jgi:integral membrane protein